MVDVNDHPPMKLLCRISSKSVDMKAQKRRFFGGGRYNSSTFSHFVVGSTYFVHSFWGYKALMNCFAKYGILRVSVHGL